MQEIIIEKPKDWPCNNREIWIENVYNALNEFIRNPNYKTKEILMSLCIHNNINEFSSRGQVRNCLYEVAMYNSLYELSHMINYHSVKIFIYRCLYDIIVINKCTSMALERNNNPIEGYNNLLPSLQLFYIVYYNVRQYKERNFVDELINVVNELQKNPQNNFENIFYAFLMLIYDISFNRAKNVLPIFDWNKVEIKKVLSKLIEMANKLNIDPLKRPFKGVFKLLLVNLILRSRDEGGRYLYKCVSDDTSNSSFQNNEIWMKDIKSLNDKREEIAISSLFVKKDWIKYDWAKSVKLKSKNTCFVTCFSNTLPSVRMQKEYGNNIYGYKTERIADVLSPIYINEKGTPFFSYVASFDVIYEQQKLKDELNYLCGIIDLFKITSQQKQELYNEFLQYWLLSYKDKKWSREKEKRFQLFLFPNDYHYIDYKIEKEYLKLKSTMFLYPDFILDNINYEKIKTNILEKTNAIAANDCFVCNNCLQVSYDNAWSEDNVCDICGSKEFIKIKR